MAAIGMGTPADTAKLNLKVTPNFGNIKSLRMFNVIKETLLPYVDKAGP
jgi:hypothetical protein